MTRPDTCPVCGEPFAFRVPSRIAFFKQGEFYRHRHYGVVYFHRIDHGIPGRPYGGASA